MRLTVNAWSRLNVSTQYTGRSLLRAVYEVWMAHRRGFARVVLEIRP